MIVLGLLLSMVGSDIETGASRLTFDIPELADGIGFAMVAMGVFGFAEIMRNLETAREDRDIVQAKITGLMPTRKDLKDFGAGDPARHGARLDPRHPARRRRVIASFAAYTFEKKIVEGSGALRPRRDRGRRGAGKRQQRRGADLVHPAADARHPAQRVMALMVGAMTIHGIVPGPQVMSKQPELFWGMIASMWVGNLMLVVINLPLVGLWVRLLRVPYRLMFPSILIFCCDRHLFGQQCAGRRHPCAVFGLVGYWLVKHDFEPAPLLLGFVLGPLMEENLRRAHADLARRLVGVCHPADLGGAAGDRGFAPGAGDAADIAQEARRSVRRIRELRSQMARSAI